MNLSPGDIVAGKQYTFLILRRLRENTYTVLTTNSDPFYCQLWEEYFIKPLPEEKVMVRKW